MVDNNLPNFDYPFTDLFSHLKRVSLTHEGRPMLVYGSKKLNIMRSHSNNAIESLLRGIQSVGLCLSITNQGDYLKEELNNLGTLISTISNLIEALNILNADIDYELSARNCANS